ncbi:HybD peptidase [Nitrospira sp.]|nr:HybD peptidase [Nitrospira sp.]
MSRRSNRPIRIVGLGNRMRGDDAAGLIAADRIRARIGARAEVIDAEMAGADLLEWFDGARAVFLIDAVRSGSPPGTLHRCDASTGPIGTAHLPHSSHALNGVDALELARILGLLPPIVLVFGIEVGATSFGRLLSPEVAAAIEATVETVCRESEALACTNSIC